MYELKGNDEIIAKAYMEEARKIALLATCERSKCGSIIVKNGIIIGSGYNSPTKDLESSRRCAFEKKGLHTKVTDKTCCVHAEQRAIMDALKKNPDKITGSRLYFVRLGEEGEIKFSGNPYCTICSKMSLDTGIQEFVLYHATGITVYDTQEYNTLSYQYQE